MEVFSRNKKTNPIDLRFSDLNYKVSLGIGKGKNHSYIYITLHIYYIYISVRLYFAECNGRTKDTKVNVDRCLGVWKLGELRLGVWVRWVSILWLFEQPETCMLASTWLFESVMRRVLFLILRPIRYFGWLGFRYTGRSCTSLKIL